jgi:DNA repair exonuclease SbcCD ATPase subunit
MDPNATYADQCIAQLQTIMLIFRDDVNDVDHKINDLTQKFEAFQQGCSAAIRRLSDSLHIREQQATGMTMRIHALEQSPVEPLLQRLQQLEGMVRQLKEIQEGSGQNIGQALAAAFEKITNTENVAERQQQLSSAIIDALRGHPSQADLQSLQGQLEQRLEQAGKAIHDTMQARLAEISAKEKAAPPPIAPVQSSPPRT